MTDIVERIRNRIHDAPMETERLLDEAAEEIELLRLELYQARGWCFKSSLPDRKDHSS